MWIPITLFAACCQVTRTSRQHALRSVLSTNAAGFTRYLYGLPLAAAAFLAVFATGLVDMPSIPVRFWPIVVAAGLAQIVGTIALLASFRTRDFAIGTAYAKSEVILVAIVAAVALDEPLRPAGWAAAAVCVTGVVWLSSRGDLRAVVRGAGDRAALLGVAAGGLFGGAAVGIRAASRALGEAPSWQRALVTLTAMLFVQTVVNGADLAVRDRAGLGASLRHWRPAALVGVLSFAGSAGWALAVTLENAAKVRALGQVELIIAYAISTWWLHEPHGRHDDAATALVLTGVVGVMILG